MLSLVTINERPDLEEMRNTLIVSNAEMKKELKELEDKILYKLSVSEGSTVDDIDLIATLDASKNKSEEIKVMFPFNPSSFHEENFINNITITFFVYNYFIITVQ